MNAGIYTRISVDEKKRQGASISSQVRGCTEYTKSKKLELYKTYTDEDWSGSTLNRPQLDKLRDAVSKGQVSDIVCYHPDRLARNQAEQFLLYSEFEKAGAKLHFVQMPDFFEGGEETQIVNKSVFAMVAELERVRIRERMRRGKREKAKQGIIIAGKMPPYGYKFEKKNGRLDYIINKDESKWVVQAYKWLLEGKSTREVTRLLSVNDAPRRTSSKSVLKPKNTWASSTVSKVLRNETYTGVYHWNKYKSIEPANPRNKTRYRKRVKSSITLRPREQWIKIARPDLKIIEPDIFKRVQKQLAHNMSRKKRKSKNFYLLKGLIVCGECGCPMYSENYHGRRYYRCSNRQRTYPNPPTCKMGSKKADDIESLVVEEIRKMFNDPDRFYKNIVEKRNKAIEEIDSAEGEIAKLDKKIAKYNKEEERVLELWKSGLTKRLDVLSGQLADIKQKRKKALAERTKLVTQRGGKYEKLMKQSAKKTLHDLEHAISSLEKEKAREIFKLLGIKTTWYGDRLDIAGYFPLASKNKNLTYF